MFKYTVYMCVLFGALLFFVLSADFKGEKVSKKTTYAVDVKNTKDSKPEAVKAELMPHKATYRLELVKDAYGDAIRSLSGSISYELTKKCNDWHTVQKTNLTINYKNDTVFDMKSQESTTESEDAKTYNFSLERKIKGLGSLKIEGSAVKNEDNGVYVNFSKPEKKSKLFPRGTIFPLEHTKRVIELASLGKDFFSYRVFSGWVDDKASKAEDGSTDVSASVMPAKKDSGTNKLLANAGIVDETPFSVHMASYLNNNTSGQPDMEVDMLIFKNGVIKSIKLDYGVFAVLGTLEELEPAKILLCD
ncbi:MAG: cell envelope integrity EipB family protein [Alphaproteobacteria bacterium]|nr:cell envelope integrity EipB family protein [Alphaproteobacteria bacterium]MCL2505881.1 cell envelope integrity EipB family protein [Alphaproteobacteria bacterium]